MIIFTKFHKYRQKLWIFFQLASFGLVYFFVDTLYFMLLDLSIFMHNCTTCTTWFLSYIVMAVEARFDGAPKKRSYVRYRTRRYMRRQAPYIHSTSSEVHVARESINFLTLLIDAMLTQTQ